MRLATFLLSAAALFCGFQSHATAGLIYSNGAPDNGSARSMSFNRRADDFTLGANATLSSIRFWWTNHIIGSLADFSGTVSYAFYQNSAGAIGSQVATGTVSGLTFTPTGGEVCGGNCPIEQTDIPLTAPVALTAGTYWLELHEGTSTIDFDGSDIYWATSSSNSGNSLVNFSSGCPNCTSVPSDGSDIELAFQLYDAQVPEPGTIGMAALGLGLVAWFRWRR